MSREADYQTRAGAGESDVPSSVGHEQDWQPYPFIAYSALCDDHT